MKRHPRYGGRGMGRQSEVYRLHHICVHSYPQCYKRRPPDASPDLTSLLSVHYRRTGCEESRDVEEGESRGGIYYEGVLLKRRHRPGCVQY
jgi:hypothetical protein